MKNIRFKVVNFKNRAGQSLVELLLAIGLSSIFLPALVTGLVISREGKAQQTQRLDAVTILKETEEAVRSYRENGWADFAVNGTYQVELVGNAWKLVPIPNPTPTPIYGIFTRQVVISDIYRKDTLSGPIVNQGEPGAILDPSTKKIVTTISWSQPVAYAISSTMYLSRFLENAAYTETTVGHFNYDGKTYPGQKTGVAVRPTGPPEADGEVILGAGGNGNWCAPSITSNTLDLPKNGVALSIFATAGNAFVGTGENASGVSMAKVNINSAQPPVPTLGYTFDGYKTNGVFGNSNYAFLATDNNAKEVVIIDLNNVIGGKYQEAGHFNAPGNGTGSSVYVVGDTGYVVVGSKLYNFNVTDMATCKLSGCPIRDTDGVVLSGNGAKMVIKGTYAYVAINSSSYKLDIIDISNPTNLVRKGHATLNSLGAKDLFVSDDGNKVYMITAQSSSQKEFFIINSTDKENPVLVVNGTAEASFDTSPMEPNGVTKVPGNIVIVVGSGGEQYKVLNVSSETSISQCGGVTIPGGVAINGVSGVLDADNNAYSYIVIAQDPEFRIIEGGPGGNFATSGEFESATFDPGYTTANNRFMANFSVQPGVNTLRFQVSMANLVGGVCPSTGSYTFVGPDGTSATYFSFSSGQSVTFPFGSFGNYTNPGQCIRYKAYFTTTDPNNTPVLNDVTINYSP